MNKFLFTLMNNANVVDKALQKSRVIIQVQANIGLSFDSYIVSYNSESNEKILVFLSRIKIKDIYKNDAEAMDIHKVTDHYNNKNESSITSFINALTYVIN
ncbi:hypothetical protein [Mycoplasmopsis agassizii]|uniref:Uncharacterized protein n=1 Tax=Mycoplasmopsis agassizii TaxID=33922 RepID=A0ABX4H4R0_9BACT|nr:hypothetical protein [Mycoplasmopsis agassizii]PAF54879.1 hypothetical protein CJF60_04040 [Mycoplasmopsis agassizii]SMC20013.1 hypothetical protein SAMN02745179_00987 [Mycoplasmopsis agassizii]